MAIDEERMQAKIKSSKKEGFRRWLEEPMTKAMISGLLPSEHLEIILQSAYESGFGYGCVVTTVELLAHVMRPPR